MWKYVCIPVFPYLPCTTDVWLRNEIYTAQYFISPLAWYFQLGKSTVCFSDQFFFQCKFPVFKSRHAVKLSLTLGLYLRWNRSNLNSAHTVPPCLCAMLTVNCDGWFVLSLMIMCSGSRVRLSLTCRHCSTHFKWRFFDIFDTLSGLEIFNNRQGNLVQIWGYNAYGLTMQVRLGGEGDYAIENLVWAVWIFPFPLKYKSS